MINESNVRSIGFGNYVMLLAAIVLQSELSATPPNGQPDVRGAIEKAIPLLEAASAGSADHGLCFSCHGQALPVMALTEARQRGFEIDETNLQRQLDHTAAFLKRGLKSYLEGKGQGGRVDTAGYALWTLEAGGRGSSEITDAVIGYVLNSGSDSGRWKHSSDRPPSEASDFTTTYLALRALSVYGQDQHQQQIAERTQAASKWLLESEPADTEDRVFHLRALSYTADDDEMLRRYADELLDQQRNDGGWAQKADMTSDAYATATVLVSLSRTGQLTPEDDVYQRGLRFLIDTQQEDGSWHVVSRSKPFQKYYESGFPHATDQFISTTASAWSIIALLLALPEPGNSDG